MLLRLSHIDCSPFSKFFLLKFTARYGDQSPWLDQVMEIIRAIELPKSRFYTVVTELRSLGILEVLKTEPTEVPQVRYRIKIEEPKICSLTLSKQPHLHKRKIDQLLIWSSRSISARPHQLTIPQRVLMIALLEEADAGGIIRNVGFSDFAQRTGLATRQVKNQMTKLREFHYVRVSLPGGNATGLTGRYNSVHALNLRHPGFGQQCARRGIVIFFQRSVPPLTEEDLNFFHYQRLKLLNHLSKLMRASRGQIGESDELVKLANRAGNLNASAPWIFLNWLCHDLASRTLSELWKELSELAVVDLDAIISKKIRGEWLSAYRAIIEVDDDEHPGQKKAVLSKQPNLPLLHLIEVNLRTTVRSIAIGIKKALKDSEVLPEQIHNYHFQILPSPHKGKHSQFALEITTPDQNQLAQTNTFALALGFNPKKEKVTANSITDIYELEHSALATTGIATPPLTCPLLSTIPRAQK